MKGRGLSEGVLSRLVIARAETVKGVMFLLLGAGMGLALISFNGIVYAAQGNVSELASALPLGYAFAAGMVATVNPCGVLLLPSLVAYYLGADDDAKLTVVQRARKAVLLGIMATLGFVVLFGLVGGVVGAGGRAIASYFPVAGLAVGLALIASGTWLTLSGRSLGILPASRAMQHVQFGSDPRSLFAFGVAYGVSSLACTLPVFLVVAGTALAARSPLIAVSQFVSYALGMGTVLTGVVLAAAFFKTAVSRWVRKAIPYVHRVAAAFLVGAGLYVSWYWLTSGQLGN